MNKLYSGSAVRMTGLPDAKAVVALDHPDAVPGLDEPLFVTVAFLPRSRNLIHFRPSLLRSG